MSQHIPRVTPEQVESLLARLTPLVKDEAGKLRTIELPNAFNQAYTWSPVLKDTVERSTLKLVARFHSLHTAGYIALFKPSLAEVLAQLPADLPESACAFELVMDSVEIVHDVPGFYGHRAQVLVYAKADAEVLDGSMRNKSIRAIAPRYEAVRVLSNVSDGIYPVRESTLSKVDSDTADERYLAKAAYYAGTETGRWPASAELKSNTPKA